MSSKKEDVKVVDVLTADVCRLIVGHLSMLACSGEEKALLASGIPKSNIRALKRLSYEDSWKLSQKADDVLDIKALLKGVFKKNVPEEYLPYLMYGANNKQMEHHFRIRASKCGPWRDDLNIERKFRTRLLPNKKYKIVVDLLNDLCEKHTPMGIPIDELLTIAQQHQVSLGAMWTELEKWDEEDEADKKKQKK
ncbi:hypothetical protein [Vibrio scophthalmi]|uniref:Uncharacterized protein n=1 Tax=Vibrio scophthalmi TaxID=45658 RepID=A0A1C7FHN7_9VIBR|nr:hypothetical protein [Vibrio scophthalmi]ANU39480.1 hypothetical protein VSVS05_04445 [Vibrio scophthalmi]